MKIVVWGITAFVICSLSLISVQSISGDKEVTTSMLEFPFLQQPGKIKPYWYETWGGGNDEGAIGVDAYGNHIYVVGVIVSSDTLNAFLLKYDRNGNLIWDTTWAGEGMAGATDVVVYNDYIYIAGTIGSEENADSVLSKYDSNGNLIWHKTWGGNDYEIAWGIGIYNDYIYLCGNTDSFGAGAGDIFLLKYDMDGNLIWHKTWGGVETEEGGRVMVSDDGVYVTGITSSYGYGMPGDAVLLKYDTDGNLVWAKTWGGDDTDRSIGLDISQGYVYVTGYTYSYGHNIFLLKYDADGNLIWNKTWGGIGDDDGMALKIYDNAIYVVGDTYSYGEGNGDIVLLKYADDGALSWAKTWGGAESEFPYDIDIENKMIYITGYTESFGAEAKDALLLKCNLEGKKVSFPIFDNLFKIIRGKLMFDVREIMPVIYLI